MTTDISDIEAAQRGCACPRIDAHDCAWVRAGMPHDDAEEGSMPERERCQCGCHDEIDALMRDDNEGDHDEAVSG